MSAAAAALMVMPNAGAGAGVIRPSAAAVGSTDWPAYERNPAHSSAIPTDPAITTGNAGQLRNRWHFLADLPTRAGQPGRRFDASPTVVAGRVYLGSRTGMFYVLNAATGAVVWKRQLDFGSSAFCPAKGLIGTATVQPDPVDHVLTVYVPGAHYLYALNAATGVQRWRTSIGPATVAGNGLYLNWSSPTVAGGRIFMGLAAACESHLIRGGVVALSQHTGAVQHTYFAVPAGKVGASVWSSAASDGTAVWVTTGNPDPNGTTIDDSYSVVRLAAATLVKQDKWTVPSGQTADLDFGSSPTLFAGTVAGVSTPLVGACNKNGVFYAWRRTNLAAGPVWSRLVGTSGAADVGACLTSAAWDFAAQRLFVASNQTTIAGTAFPGGLRALDPSSGAVLWERSLPCVPVGSPTVNGQIVAVPLYGCPAGVAPSVKLYRETDGALLATVAATGKTFAQPVFAAGLLFVASEDGTITAYGP